MDINFVLFAILMFCGGFINAVSGGGGMITVPAYMLLNIPMVNVVGTNKLSGGISSLISFSVFLRRGKINMPLLTRLIPATFVGAILGAFTFHKIDAQILETLVPVLILSIAVYSMFDKNLGTTDEYTPPTKGRFIKGSFVAFIVGFYDAFFGPGAGIFFAIMLVKIFKLDFVGAVGGSKVLNLVSAITAVTIYTTKGSVMFKYGLLGCLFISVGSLVGSKIAISKGVRFIKPVFTTVALLIALNILRMKLNITSDVLRQLINI